MKILLFHLILIDTGNTNRERLKSEIARKQLFSLRHNQIKYVGSKNETLMYKNVNIYQQSTQKKNRKQMIKIDLNTCIFKIKYGEYTEKTSMTLYVSVALSTVAFCLIIIMR